MIFLNKMNGELHIDDHIFTNGTLSQEVESLSVKSYQNSDYSHFVWWNLNNGELSLMFSFKNEKLKWINVGLMETEKPFEITDEDVRKINVIAKQLGGEEIYDWGNVAIDKDQRGGNIRVVISYNQ